MASNDPMELAKQLKIKKVDTKSALSQEDRITLSCVLHFEQFGEEAVTGVSEGSFTQKQSEEPAFQRWVYATEDLEPMDTGWVDDVGYVLLESRVGRGLSLNPSSEQEAEMKKQIVEVRTSTDAAPMLLFPGLPLMAFFTEPPLLRCRHGKCKIHVTVIPNKIK